MNDNIYFNPPPPPGRIIIIHYGALGRNIHCWFLLLITAFQLLRLCRHFPLLSLNGNLLHFLLPVGIQALAFLFVLSFIIRHIVPHNLARSSCYCIVWELELVRPSKFLEPRLLMDKQ
ncbi:hypothetical protein F5X98DRAFT_355544 [Xylaria grammica]|nr:hypothetical protein F5X98DRAFT_355544 [Xylaria grammica]